MKNKIVLVDDDQNILTSVSILLEEEGYRVVCFNDGLSGLDGIIQERPDLVILDIKMPRLDGEGVLQRLRETSNVPVVFLTSKDDEEDEVLGLRLGADDYIKKPFSQNLLLERIKVILRRESERSKNNAALQGAAQNSAQKSPDDQSLEDTEERWVRGDLEMELGRFECFWKKQQIHLTVTEFLLLKVLAEKPGVVKNRNQLIDHAYGVNIYVDDRTVDSHIKRLRKKFKDQDSEFECIETVYGLGYKFKC